MVGSSFPRVKQYLKTTLPSDSKDEPETWTTFVPESKKVQHTGLIPSVTGFQKQNDPSGKDQKTDVSCLIIPLKEFRGGNHKDLMIEEIVGHIPYICSVCLFGPLSNDTQRISGSGV